MDTISAVFLVAAVWVFGIGIGLALRAPGSGEDRVRRERFNLALLDRLGADNMHVQLAAAAMLLERLKELAPSRKDSHVAERRSLAASLLAVLKERSPPAPASAPDASHVRGAASSTTPYPSLVLHKLIAENMVDILGARLADRALPNGSASPLHDYDFQRVSVEDADWHRVDARQIDFYGADLRGSSLRDALLNGAVLYEADLTNAILKGTDLRGTNLSGTTLVGAKYDAGTKWPEGFDPKAAGAVLES